MNTVILIVHKRVVVLHTHPNYSFNVSVKHKMSFIHTYYIAATIMSTF